MINNYGSPILVNCTFTGNWAGWTAGGMSNFMSNPLLINCTFAENWAGIEAGGLGNYVGSHPTLIGCTFTRNSSGILGGGMTDSESALTLINCTLTGNSARRGGGLHSVRSDTLAINCTFIGNSAENAGGGIFKGEWGGPRTINCIFWANSVSGNINELAQIEGYVRVDYSCIQGWSGTLGGVGNIGADPCFVELGYWDANGLWVGGDYHLLPDSPCIDAGDPNYPYDPNETDLDGKPRVIGGRIDMGAYEFNHIPVADAGPDQAVYAWIDGIAEVNLDGTGSYDEDGQPLTYLWRWTVDGNTMTQISTDADGIINLLDFAVFAAQYPLLENPLLNLSVITEAWLTTPSSANWNPQCDIRPTGAIVTIELPVGEHIIELIVNDGIDDSEPNQVVITVIEPMEAHLWMFPRVINRYSRESKILALLRLPEGVTRDQIDSSEPLLLYPAGSEAIRQYVIQYRRHGAQQVSIFAFFDKGELMAAVPDDGRVELQVVGELATGRYFYGTDMVRIIGRRRMPRRSLRGRNSSSITLGR